MPQKKKRGRPRTRPRTRPRRRTTTTPANVRAYWREQARRRRDATRVRPYTPRPNARRVTHKKRREQE